MTGVVTKDGHDWSIDSALGNASELSAVRDDDASHKPARCGNEDAAARARRSGGPRMGRAVDPGAIDVLHSNGDCYQGDTTKRYVDIGLAMSYVGLAYLAAHHVRAHPQTPPNPTPPTHSLSCTRAH